MRAKDEDKKTAINRTVIKLVNEMGYSGISMSKIAKSAGMSASLLYVYYENQEDMFRKVFTEEKQKMLVQMSENVDSNAPTQDAIHHICENLVGYLRDNEESMLFIEQSLNSPLIRGIPQEMSLLYGKSVIEVVQKGIQDGILKDASPVLLIGFCVYPITQTYKEICRPDGMMPKIDWEQVYSMCWDAIRK